ncbi:MAG: peptide-methionine (S)-S-oxide reductase MsrA, partial [archaeon]|nr:peptide-methionine (S)-S-oxide reductase MsrA [archaeon]
MKEAYFGMGCFWKPQYLFSKVKGLKIEVGYMGGSKKATYEEVCTGKTGHAEVIKIVYDEKKNSYESLLKRFWEKHNPTTPNRQGPDIGNQYRSVIFYTDENQKRLSEKSKKETEKKIGRKVVTELSKSKTFYP